jgi:dihydrodiol dehydrogenase / D-xylose 1-dehydrogenase (NADP)
MEKTNKIRWAILGAGKIAHKFAQDFATTSNAELVAVASRDMHRAKEFSDQYNIPNTFTYEQLYKSNLVDVVYIATPHNFHYEQCLSCMENGKAVLCEKPVTINDGQFKSLVTLANKRKVFFMEALWTYFLPSLLKAKEWIENGRIGKLKLIQADFGYAMEFNPAGRLFNPHLAGGALLDLGIYPVAFSAFFLGGKPDSVKASAYLGKTNVDETTSILFQHSGISSVLFASMAIKSINKGYLFGEKGYIELPDFFKAFSAGLYSSDHKLIESFHDERTTWGYNFEIQHVTDNIAKGILESNVVTHDRSNEIQELMTEIRRQIGLVYPMEEVLVN